jgi:hypothetical protein
MNIPKHPWELPTGVPAPGYILPHGITKPMKQTSMTIQLERPEDALLWASAFADENHAQLDYNIKPHQLSNRMFMDQKGVMVNVSKKQPKSYEAAYRPIGPELHISWIGEATYIASTKAEYYVKSYSEFRGIILTVLGEKEIFIGNYLVEFLKDHIMVGCQAVNHSTIKQIYERIFG